MSEAKPVEARLEVPLLLGLWGVITLVHFSLPMIITWDTGDYHGYLPLLRGEEPFSEWNPYRGPGFPLVLLAMQSLLGTGPVAPVILSYLFLGASFAVAVLVVRRLF